MTNETYLNGTAGFITRHWKFDSSKLTRFHYYKTANETIRIYAASGHNLERFRNIPCVEISMEEYESRPTSGNYHTEFAWAAEKLGFFVFSDDDADEMDFQLYLQEHA